MKDTVLLKYTDNKKQTITITTYCNVVSITVRNAGKIVNKGCVSKTTESGAEAVAKYINQSKLIKLTYVNNEKLLIELIKILDKEFKEKHTIKVLNNYVKLYNYQIYKSRSLSNKEISALNHITRNTGMDCWFYLYNNDKGEWLVRDLEERKTMALSTGIKMMAEGLGSIKDWGLSDSETLTLAAILDRFGVKL